MSLSLETRLGQPIGASVTGWKQFHCPFCPGRKGTEDKNGHFYLNEEVKFVPEGSGWFVCHRCGVKGPLTKLQDLLGFEMSSPTEDKFFSTLQAILAPEPIGRPQFPHELPRDYHKLIKGCGAYNYLIKRGLSAETMEYFNCGFGTQDLSKIPEEERRFFAGKNRVVFLDYDREGGLDYWVARYYGDREVKAKYKNAPWDCVDRIFHLSRVRGPFVVITEGPLDCMVSAQYLQGNVIATYGKMVTPEQIIRLCEDLPQVEVYFVALDPDAPKETATLASKLAHRYKDVRIVSMPEGQDPASLGPKFPDHLSQAVPFSLT